MNAEALVPEPVKPAAFAQRIHESHGEAARRGGAAHRTHAIGHRDQPPGAAHVKASQPRDSRMAAFTMPTSEYVCG